MSGLEVITFGCRLNAYESEVIRARARAAGLTESVIVNTCAVTGEAERQARQAIRRARRRNPDATIIATGCAAQLDPEGYAAMPEVDRVVGNREKLTLEGLTPDADERVAVGDIMAVRETAGHLIAGYEARARAFVQVQNGCDHRCTFCIIPFARGPSRSVPLGAIAAEVRALVANGHREVVLSGVDLGHYGTDLPGRPRLGEAVRRLLQAVPELPRLRLSSIDPVEIDPALERLFAEEPRLMPHLHLSVQAGDDMVLKRMKRRHSRADVLALCRRLRALRPGIAFGADLIAGFPTETQEMFENTRRLIADAGLIWLHVFPYSPRPGTPAARMPQVPVAERRTRAAALRAAVEGPRRRFLEGRVGRESQVLLEKAESGRDECFAEVAFDRPAGSPGELVRADYRSDRRPPDRDRRLMAREDGGGRGLLARLKAGLRRTSNSLTSGIGAIFTGRRLDEAALEELEELLIAGDLGAATAAELTAALAQQRFGAEVTAIEVRRALADQIADLLAPVEGALAIDDDAKPHVILVAGVNGTGKTTTIGKLAQSLSREGRRVMLVAGDTFRAAAVEQLTIWGERAGAPVVARPDGGDPAGLAFDALERARAEGIDVLLIDTAGRLQNKAHLMAELQKIDRVLKKLDPRAPHSRLLVLDATTGQNALNQVDVFREAIAVDGLVMTKLDGTAKGGVLVALAQRFGVPVVALGIGEGIDDLRPFEARAFATALMGLDE